MLKEARATGTEVKIIANVNIVVARESAQVIQAAWDAVGFKVTVEPLDTVPFSAARTEGKFDALIRGPHLPLRPERLLSAICTPRASGTESLRWQNERYDRLVEEAKRTIDRPGARSCTPRPRTSSTSSCRISTCMTWSVPRRRSRNCRATSRGLSGAVTYQGGGLRTAYMAG